MDKKNITQIPTNEDAYAIWKENPENSVVIDPNKLDTMLGGNKHVAFLAVEALKNAFADKDIIIKGELPLNNLEDDNKSIRQNKSIKPTLNILSGIPGSGKSSFAKQIAAYTKDTVVVTNDLLRGSLTGVEEADINKKIWNTSIDTAEGRKTMEDFAKPKINIAKNALIETFLSQGYTVIADGVHPNGDIWDGFQKYQEKATIIHTLVTPDSLRKCIKKAAARKDRPENRQTIVKVGKRIQNLMNEQNDDGTPKYKFDKIITNHYEDGGFEDTTEKYYNNK